MADDSQDSQELSVASEGSHEVSAAEDLQNHIRIFEERYVETHMSRICLTLSVLELVKEFFYVYYQCMPDAVTTEDDRIFDLFKDMYVKLYPVWTKEEWDKSLNNIVPGGVLSNTKGLAGVTNILDLSIAHAIDPFNSDFFHTEARTGKNEMHELWNYEAEHSNDSTYSPKIEHKQLIFILVGEIIRSAGQIQRSTRMCTDLLKRYVGEPAVEELCKKAITKGLQIIAHTDSLIDAATRFAFIVKHDVTDDMKVSEHKKQWMREGKKLFCEVIGLTLHVDDDNNEVIELRNVIPMEDENVVSPWEMVTETRDVFPALGSQDNLYFASQGFILFVVNKLRHRNLFDSTEGIFLELREYYEKFNKTSTSWDTRLGDRRALRRGGSAGGGPGGGGGGNGNQMGGGGGGRPGAASGGYQGDRRRAGAGPQAYQSRAGGARRNTHEEYIRKIEALEQRGIQNPNYKGKNYKFIRALQRERESGINQGSTTSESGSESGSESASTPKQCPFCEWTTSDRNPLHALTVHMRQRANEARELYKDKANEVDMHANFESMQGLENDLNIQELLAARDIALAGVPAVAPGTTLEDYPLLPGQETSGSDLELQANPKTIACPFCTWTFRGENSLHEWFLHMRNAVKTAHERLDEADATEPHAMFLYQHGLDERDPSAFMDAENYAATILPEADEQRSPESSVRP